MNRDHRFDPWIERDTATSALPLGAIACGRGLRRAGPTRRELAREYDDWTDRPFERTRDDR